jgi:hypothetical protein
MSPSHVLYGRLQNNDNDNSPRIRLRARQPPLTQTNSRQPDLEFGSFVHAIHKTVAAWTHLCVVRWNGRQKAARD